MIQPYGQKAEFEESLFSDGLRYSQYVMSKMRFQDDPNMFSGLVQFCRPRVKTIDPYLTFN